ncbi:MAG: methyltransferase domain-containing protein [Thioploca sp.]|nr:methyltransferase domain-containing protein [Thioploca sp.]
MPQKNCLFPKDQHFLMLKNHLKVFVSKLLKMRLRLMNQVNNNLEQLKALYNQSWTSALTHQREDFGDLEASLQFIKRLNISKKSRMLEIGCAIGKLCNELSKMGFSEVMGIDISEIAI